MRGWIEDLVVKGLHLMTARAMGVSIKDAGILPKGKIRGYWKQALPDYATFTRVQMAKTSKDEMKRVRRHMYRTSRKLGTLIRHLLWIRSEERARKVIFYLYRCIGIDMTANDKGEYIVHACYFSRTYSPYMCQVMSAMDKGVFAGIFGGKQLSFEKRLTEGSDCCLATLK